MTVKDVTAELLEASKATAARENRTMLVFLIEMALLEADLSAAQIEKRGHPARIPQIPRQTPHGDTMSTLRRV